LAGIVTADSGTYTVVVVDSNGCVSSASMNVGIAAAPNAGASNNGPLCAGGTIALFSGGGIGYSWTGPNGFTSNQQNPMITNSSLADSGIYTVTVTGSGGCSASKTTSVTITSSTSATASNSGAVCSGSTVNLFAG